MHSYAAFQIVQSGILTIYTYVKTTTNPLKMFLQYIFHIELCWIKQIQSHYWLFSLVSGLIIQRPLITSGNQYIINLFLWLWLPAGNWEWTADEGQWFRNLNHIWLDCCLLPRRKRKLENQVEPGWSFCFL